MAKELRYLSLVILKKRWAEDPIIQEARYFSEQPLVYLGEIPNMPEHGIFISHRTGQIFSGLHIQQFKELKRV